jgi:hypothetical protein
MRSGAGRDPLKLEMTPAGVEEECGKGGYCGTLMFTIRL